MAVSAALSPLLLTVARALYLSSGGSPRIGTTAATVLRLVLSTLVLAVPTLAMGGTLPAAARAATRANDTRRQDLAVLYAINTLGAVAGCLLSTFFLLEIFGTRQTLWLAAAVNLLVAMVARQTDRTWAGQEVAAGQAGGAQAPPRRGGEVGETRPPLRTPPAPQQEPATHPRRPRPLCRRPAAGPARPGGAQDRGHLRQRQHHKGDTQPHRAHDRSEVEGRRTPQDRPVVRPPVVGPSPHLHGAASRRRKGQGGARRLRGVGWGCRIGP